MSGPGAGGCCSSPLLDVGMPDEIQDAQLYLNFRETVNNSFIICMSQILHMIYL